MSDTAQAPGRPEGRPGLLRSATVYGAAGILDRIIPALILPVLTFYLTSADVGMFAIFTAVSAIAAPLVGLNVAYVVRRRYFDADRTHFPAYLTGCVWIVAAGALGGVLVAVVGGAPLARLTGLTPLWLAAAIVLAASHELLSIPLTLWQVEHQPRRFAVAQVVRTALVAGLTVLLVIGVGLGWQGAAAANLIVTLTFAIGVIVTMLRPRMGRRVEMGSVLDAVRYGSGLIAHRLGSLGLRSADRVIIAYYVGASETGLYFAAVQIGLAISVVAEGFNRAWSPWLYGRLAERREEGDRRIVRLTYAYFAGIATLALVLTLVAPPVIRLVLAPEFHGAARFVGWIAIGAALNAMYLPIAGVVFFAERTLVISWITGVSVIVAVALNLLLVPWQGAMGAAQAGAAALFLKFLLTWVAAQRTRPLPWRLSA